MARNDEQAIFYCLAFSRIIKNRSLVVLIARSVLEIYSTRKNVTEEEEELGILGSGLVALWKNHYFPPALI